MYNRFELLKLVTPQVRISFLTLMSKTLAKICNIKSMKSSANAYLVLDSLILWRYKSYNDVWPNNASLINDKITPSMTLKEAFEAIK